MALQPHHGLLSATAGPCTPQSAPQDPSNLAPAALSGRHSRDSDQMQGVLGRRDPGLELRALRLIWGPSSTTAWIWPFWGPNLSSDPHTGDWQEPKHVPLVPSSGSTAHSWVWGHLGYPLLWALLPGVLGCSRICNPLHERKAGRCDAAGPIQPGERLGRGPQWSPARPQPCQTQG